MKQEIVRLNGMIYDYCEDVKFYSMLGFLDQETKTFRGIEVVSASQVDLKASFHSKEGMRIVCGAFGDTMTYYAIDMVKGEIIYTKLTPNQAGFSGRENTLCVNLYMREQDSNFKFASGLEKVEDAELELMLMQTLKLNGENPILNGLQEAALSTEAKQKKIGA